MGTTTATRRNEATGALTAAVSARRRELAWLAILLGSTFATLAVLGRDEADPTWFNGREGDVANVCGPLGAAVAEALFAVLGWGSLGVFGVMVLSVMALAGRPVFDRVRTPIALALGWLGLAGIERVAKGGGWLGRALNDLLVGLLGPVGMWLAILSGFVLGLTVLLRIDWGRVARALVAEAETYGPVVAAWGGRVGRRGGEMAWAGTTVAARGTGALATAGASAGWSTVLRGWASLRRGGLPSPVIRRDVSTVTADVPDRLSEDDEMGLPGEGDTLAGVPAGVAEVRWDPTSASSQEMLGMFPAMERRTRTTDVPVVLVDEDTAASPEVAERTELPADMAPPAAPATPLDAPPAPKRHGVVVRRAAHLDERVRDDGRSVQSTGGAFELPRLGLLDLVPAQRASFDAEELRAMARRVEETLLSFKVNGSVTDVRVGPVVTTLEYLPEKGISVRRILALADDLAMALRALSVRIVAPIPGKGVVGIEIPSSQRLTIYLRELLASDAFRDAKGSLPVVLGKDVEGAPVVADLAAMPHLLVGGSTGSGKSVGVNGMLLSLLFTKTPDELRLLLVDPKKLEFKPYENVPHLLHPVVTEPKQAAAALAWACREMDERYALLARWDTRNIASYNKKVETESAHWTAEKARKYAPPAWPQDEPPPKPEKLPFIVIVIDELADLMLVARKEVEGSIARLTQMARACGIHLIVATQRPSVDVVTGLIKSNLPTRIAFKLRTVIDSRTVLDAGGAEALLGRGDLLLLPNAGDLVRLHGPFVSDDEVVRVADFLRGQGSPRYIHHITAEPSSVEGIDDADRDELFDEAVAIVKQRGHASTSLIQRHLKIGYNRAARIVELMELAGIVGPADGARGREVIG